MGSRFILFGSVFAIAAATAFVGDRASRPSDAYDIQIREAERAMRNGFFESASASFHRAFLLASDSHNRNYQVYCLMKSAILAWNLGKMSESSRLFEGALKTVDGRTDAKGARRFCETALLISDRYRKAKNFREAGDFEKSIEFFKVAVKLARSIESPELEVKCLRQLSVCYWEKNELEKYFDLNRTAREIANSLRHRREEGICLNNMGIYLSFTNDYSKALEYFDRALSLLEPDGPSENISNCLNNLAILYAKFSDYEKAIDYIKRAVSIDEKFQNSINICTDLNNLGLFYKNKGDCLGRIEDYQRALEYLNESLKTADLLKTKKFMTKTNNNIGEVYFSLGYYDKALTFFFKAKSNLELLSDTNEICSVLNNLGKCYIKKSKVTFAMDYFLKTLQKESQILNSDIVREAYYGLGQCYEFQDSDERALDCYKKCAAIVNRIRGHIFIDSFKSGFARTKLNVYGNLLNVLSKMRRTNPSAVIDEEIFANIERAKARAFLEGLAESRVDIKKKLDPELQNEEKRISEHLSEITMALNRLGASSQGRSSLVAKLLREQESYLRLISKMRSADPALASLVQPEIATLRDIRGCLLNRDTVLVEYFLLEPASLMVVVDKDRLEIFLLPSKTELINSVKGYIKFLSSRSLSDSAGRMAASRIFRQLLSPLQERALIGTKRLVIVPDGILFFLPFETLIDAEWKDGRRYLVERYEISYIPSASTLKFLATLPDATVPSEGLLALGDPVYRRAQLWGDENPRVERKPEKDDAQLGALPYSREEIETIAKYFSKGRRRLFLGAKARETAIKNLSGHKFSIIHLACHSVVDEIHPFRSALVMSAPESGFEDGVLQVSELYNLKLPADLVVLSSCRTARGQMESWEGVLGMPRIFFYTGARSVLSTLWPIEDRSTAFFMDRFYGGLSRGLSKARSLQQAKIDMMRAGYRDPHYWAPFVLNGDPWSSIVMGNQRAN